MEHFVLPLSRTPDIRISCSSLIAQSHSESPKNTLLVFLTGIDNPSTIWHPTVDAFVSSYAGHPPILLYDRPGQGATTGRRADVPGRPKGHGGDCADAAHDLREVIVEFGNRKLGHREDGINEVNLVFIASSISCAIARLYAQYYPRSNIGGLLFLDSTIANSDTISILPDPEAPGFKEGDLQGGTTLDELHKIRKVMIRLFHKDSPNKEGLWRGNLPELLPHAGGPAITRRDGGTPWLTVLERDPVVAVKGAQIFGIPMNPWNVYFAPHWHEYNKALATIVPKERSKGPVIAKGCGHLIHHDGPKLVAEEIAEILDKLKHEEGPMSKI